MSPIKFPNDDFDHHHERSIRKMIEINGHRPSPLKINKDSHHVIHRVVASSSNNHNNKKQQQQQQKQPIIRYTHSPKVIHTQPKDFMALVQKLTGLSGSTAADHEETAPTAAETTKKRTRDVNHDHDSSSSSVLTDNDQKRGGGDVGGCGGYNNSSSSISHIMKAPANPFLADMPLFTPTSTENFFCSPRPVFKFPETNFASPNTGNPISPSFIEFMKGLPEC